MLAAEVRSFPRCPRTKKHLRSRRRGTTLLPPHAAWGKAGRGQQYYRVATTTNDYATFARGFSV